MSKDFSFKQFTITQKNAAFKVGTDSVVLGAWANVSAAKNILDIGTGTGLLALMGAQRNAMAAIMAIEKDALSVQDAQANFNSSPWKDRFSLETVDLADFHTVEKFDYLICNPPYFLNALQSNDERKMQARHAAEGWFHILATQVDLLSTEEGIFCCVLPAAEFQILDSYLNQKSWSVFRKMNLLPFPGGSKIRILAEWKRGEHDEDVLPDLHVRNEQKKISSEYISLTQHFYLNF